MDIKTLLTLLIGLTAISGIIYAYLNSVEEKNEATVGKLQEQFNTAQKSATSIFNQFNLNVWGRKYLEFESQDIEYFKAISAIDALQNDDVEYEELPEGESSEEDSNDTADMIHENETADEKSYYSDYDEETDEELEKELPDATDVLDGGDEETDEEIEEELLNDDGICKPIRHFVFHKKHKCGSTAFRFIFQAYAHKHSLIGAKTYMGPFLGGYPGRFDPRFVAKRLEYYDYASSHVRWDGPAFRSVFPSDTKYLTVLREPLSHFESTFNFFYSRHHTLASAQGRKNDICCWGMPFSAVAGWNTDAVSYLRIAPDRWNSTMPWAGRGRNFQAFELGWDVEQTDEKYLKDKIIEMESDFDLVMISNYYFESLVLLKNELCMDWSDLYVPPTKVKHYAHANFTAEDKTSFRNFYHQDTLIYDHFNKTFWDKINEYGADKMKNDVGKLKRIYARCDEDRHEHAGNNQCGFKGHESIKWDGRKRVQSGTMAELTEYMYQNGGGCQWGKFPSLWKAHFPERPLNL